MALMVWPPEESEEVLTGKVALPPESVAVLVPVTAALSTRIWTEPVGGEVILVPLALATAMVIATLPEELLQSAAVVVMVVLEMAEPVVTPLPVGVASFHLVTKL